MLNQRMPLTLVRKKLDSTSALSNILLSTNLHARVVYSILESSCPRDVLKSWHLRSAESYLILGVVEAEQNPVFFLLESVAYV